MGLGSEARERNVCVCVCVCLSFSLSLSLTHTHTHTHTLLQGWKRICPNTAQPQQLVKARDLRSTSCKHSGICSERMHRTELGPSGSPWFLVTMHPSSRKSLLHSFGKPLHQAVMVRGGGPWWAHGPGLAHGHIPPCCYSVWLRWHVLELA